MQGLTTMASGGANLLCQYRLIAIARTAAGRGLAMTRSTRQDTLAAHRIQRESN